MAAATKVKHFPEFQAAVSALTTKLPQSAAASIGRTIVRHSYMQWRQGKILYNLLGISIKQGRAADIRVPGPSAYIRMVKDLLLFHRAQLTGFKYGLLKDAIEDADTARNILAHSVFLLERQTGQLKIQIVRGSWDVVSLSRALQPEGRPVDRAFLKKQRAAVENGIAGVEALRRLIDATLRGANAKRESDPAWNRRRPRASNS